MMDQRSFISVWVLVFVMVLSQYGAFAQGTQPINPASWDQAAIQKRMAEQVVLFPQDKIYLHTDRSHYVVGESIWFRAYVVDAFLHIPVNRNDYVFVELIHEADSVLTRVRIRKTEGAFSGVLDLPLSLAEGSYVLRAYSDHLRNMAPDYFFHKKIQVYAPMAGSASAGSHAVPGGERLLHIDFFPEGGHLIEGAPNRIAFQASWQDGRAADVVGELVDDDGIAYGPVRTLYEGMGLIQLTPLPGKRYRLVFDESIRDDGERFVLPEGTSDSYGLRAKVVGKELQVTVLKGSGWDTSTALYVLLHTRGMVHYWLPWDMNYRSMAFDVSDFPSGVTQVLLLDGAGRAVSERLVFFNHAGAGAVGDVESAKLADEERELVRVTLALKDAFGNPLKGDFSVSVVDKQLGLNPGERDVWSTLLLDSELTGAVPNPGFYLEGGREKELDLLMMIHGWRRYAIPEVLAEQYARPSMPVGEGMAIRGWVETPSGRPARGSTVSLMSWETGFYEEVVTGEDGRFAFTGFEAPDSLSLVVQAKSARGGNDLIVHLDPETFPAVSSLAGMFSSTNASVGEHVRDAGLNAEAHRLRNTLLERRAAAFDGDTFLRRIDIEEVAVEARRVPTRQENYSFYMPTDGRNVLTAEQLEEIQAQTISDALRHIPFVTVQEDSSSQLKAYIGRMRNNSMMAATSGLGQPAVVVIDDMIIQDYDLDMLMDPSNIEKIGVLQGPAAMLLGGQGVGGAIVISTKKGLPSSVRNQSSKSIRLVSPLGYQSLDAKGHSGSGDDPQSTIYWNPRIKLNERGEAAFEFYLPRQFSDKGLSYQITMEGIAEDGTIIHLVR